jgi:hypothetical protein
MPITIAFIRSSTFRITYQSPIIGEDPYNSRHSIPYNSRHSVSVVSVNYAFALASVSFAANAAASTYDALTLSLSILEIMGIQGLCRGGPYYSMA